jgi:hypothetical protein
LVSRGGGRFVDAIDEAERDRTEHVARMVERGVAGRCHQAS